MPYERMGNSYFGVLVACLRPMFLDFRGWHLQNEGEKEGLNVEPIGLAAGN